MRLFSHKKRPVHLGPYPLERLPRIAGRASVATINAATRQPAEAAAAGSQAMSNAYTQYLTLYDEQTHRRGLAYRTDS